MSTLTFASVLSPIALFMSPAKALSVPLPKPNVAQTSDDPIDEPTAEEEKITPDTQLIVPEYNPGTPTPTNSSEMKQSGAKLAWTATGVATVQDEYNVIVTAAAATDEASGRLSGEPVMPLDQTSHLTTAHLDISSLPDGTYYWQVSSCAAGASCSTWSEVARVTIDGTAPLIPIAAVTSGLYNQDVVVTGATDPGSTVVLTVGDTTCQTLAKTDGTWNCAFETPFEYGVYDMSVKAIDGVGNESAVLTVTFIVKELFIAPPITIEELPSILEVVPVDDMSENRVTEQSLTMAYDSSAPMAAAGSAGNVASDRGSLSMDGGIVQSSEDGWQVLGMPWYIWAGLGGMLSAGWVASSGRLLRSGTM